MWKRAALFLLFSAFTGIAWGDGLALTDAHRFKRLLAQGDPSYLHLLTGDDGDGDKSKWDRFYRRNKGYAFGKEPAASLAQHYTQLPVGRVLDIAMGEGRNAVFLAKKGFEVEGVDISPEAVHKAKRLARENHVPIRAVIADLTKYQIEPQAFSVILVYYYLPRHMTQQIVAGLKPCGMLVFEANTVDQLKHDKHSNRDYLLGRDELPVLFKGLRTLEYRESDSGKDATAFLLAQKPGIDGQACKAPQSAKAHRT